MLWCSLVDMTYLQNVAWSEGRRCRWSCLVKFGLAWSLESFRSAYILTLDNHATRIILIDTKYRLFKNAVTTTGEHDVDILYNYYDLPTIIFNSNCHIKSNYINYQAWWLNSLHFSPGIITCLYLWLWPYSRQVANEQNQTANNFIS